MVAKNSKTPLRKPRADAERNRQHLLATAKKIFSEKGAAASLEEIARTAEVGIGTLYRHFPTRDALVEEVYKNELHQVTTAAEGLLKTHSPLEAVRLWLGLFLDYTVTKHGMLGALNSLTGGPNALYAASMEPIRDAMNLLIQRGVDAGEIRPLDEPIDLLRALSGVARENAPQMIEILVAGIRATPKPKSKR